MKDRPGRVSKNPIFKDELREIYKAICDRGNESMPFSEVLIWLQVGPARRPAYEALEAIRNTIIGARTTLSGETATAGEDVLLRANVDLILADAQGQLDQLLGLDTPEVKKRRELPRRFE
jgi:hypothetical protein